MYHKHEISSSNDMNNINSTIDTLSSYIDLDMGIMNDILYNSSSSNNKTNTTSENCNNDGLKAVADFVSILRKYYVPILVCAGSIGNIFSIIVIFKTKLCQTSCNYYLAALAVSDTCFLFVLFVTWMDPNLEPKPYNTLIICQLNHFLTSFSWFCSSWFVVAFTFERFIVVLYPFKNKSMCTLRRAKMVLLGLTTVGCIHCIPFWISAELRYNVKHKTWYCDSSLAYREFMRMYNNWDAFTVFAVPVILIAIFNTRTACNVWKFPNVRSASKLQKRRRKNMPKNDSITSTSLTRQNSRSQNSSFSRSSIENAKTPHQHHHGSSLRKHSANESSPNRTQIKVTKMLMVVSTVFVGLNFPSCVARIIQFYQEEQQPNSCTTKTSYCQSIFDPLFLTNFGINFVLYCVSGQNFRKEVLSLFGSRMQREGTTTQVTVTENCRVSFGGNSTSSRLRQTSCSIEPHDLQTPI